MKTRKNHKGPGKALWIGRRNAVVKALRAPRSLFGARVVKNKKRYCRKSKHSVDLRGET